MTKTEKKEEKLTSEEQNSTAKKGTVDNKKENSNPEKNETAGRPSTRGTMRASSQAASPSVTAKEAFEKRRLA